MLGSESPSVAERSGRDATVAIAIKSLRRSFFKGIEAAVFGLVLGLLCLILLQVTARYLLHISLPWTEEMARIALLWTVMFGAAVAMERREHYAITIVSHQLRPPVDWIVTLAANLIGLIFLIIFCIYGLKFAETGMRASYVSLGIPRGWVYVALPVGGALMSFSLISQSVETFLFRNRPLNQTGAGSVDGNAGSGEKAVF